ncbi:hypothetical protein pb186bvf_020091 [Paramecium bursaria]
MQQQIFNNRYLVQKKISAGSFGVVLLGLDKETKQEVAIKIEKEENEEVRSLEREVEVLNRLIDCDGAPKLYWQGEQDDYNVIIIQLLGKDLAYHMKNKKKFTLKTVIQLGINILRCLERIHLRGVVHRDLKPENILLGIGEESQKIYLVDFGISKIFRDPNGRHIPFRDNKPFIGTTRYASIAAHRGYELSRKDDIESMMYGKIIEKQQKSRQLPWQNMQNVTDEERTLKVGDMKQKIDSKELCKDLPIQFSEILEYLKGLQFRSDPDYDRVEQYFIEASNSLGFVMDQTYDWDQQLQQWLTSPQTSLTERAELQKQTTLQQQNQVQMSIDGKLLDRQQSQQKNPMLTSNFLIPPDPKQNKLQVNLKRQDSRQNSVCSGQESILPSTYNSMFPVYQSSVVNKQQNVKSSMDSALQKDQLVKQMIESQQMIKDSQQKQSTEIKGPSVQNQIRQDTIGYRDYDQDEYYQDAPLAQKYNILKLKQVQMYYSIQNLEKEQNQECLIVLHKKRRNDIYYEYNDLQKFIQICKIRRRQFLRGSSTFFFNKTL